MNEQGDKRYRVDCRIDGKWFSNKAVFPNMADARAYGEDMVDCGAASSFRLVGTDAPVNPPETDDEGEPSDEDGSSLCRLCDTIDWDTVLLIQALCPVISGSNGGGIHAIFVDYRVCDQETFEELFHAA